MSDKLKIFAENMKKKREDLRKTQRGLAEEVGITAATISAYEKQIKFPSLENALTICEALGCTLDEMCGVDITHTKEDIETYSDAFRMLMLVVDKINGFLENVTFYDAGYDREYRDIGIMFNDNCIRSFLTDWRKVRDLYFSETIDEELYIAWQEKKLREYRILINDIGEGYAGKAMKKEDFASLEDDDDSLF